MLLTKEDKKFLEKLAGFINNSPDRECYLIKEVPLKASTLCRMKGFYHVPGELLKRAIDRAIDDYKVRQA